ncbi:hypothetical protein BN1723_010908 [Verticillium longisporum]|uniref:Uncharacterized protein n=1 Tax=Verticillium longisporum TaxID=100787 RepID=A0A0G4L377_VERLO|nr:hypothetical protein BN1723_010908 [Verticillium longisporum]
MAPLVFQAISLLNGPTHTQTPKLGSDQAAQRKLQNRGKLTAGRSKGCTSLQGFRNPLALHNSRVGLRATTQLVYIVLVNTLRPVPSLS